MAGGLRERMATLGALQDVSDEIRHGLNGPLVIPTALGVLFLVAAGSFSTAVVKQMAVGADARLPDAVQTVAMAPPAPTAMPMDMAPMDMAAAEPPPAEPAKAETAAVETAEVQPVAPPVALNGPQAGRDIAATQPVVAPAAPVVVPAPEAAPVESAPATPEDAPPT